MKQRAHTPVLSETAAAAIPPVTGDSAALLDRARQLLPADRILSAPEDLFSYECDAQMLDCELHLAAQLTRGTYPINLGLRTFVWVDDLTASPRGRTGAVSKEECP